MTKREQEMVSILGLVLAPHLAASFAVPVVAVFTKFDDLITQIYNEDLEEEANRRAADRELQSKFQVPLMGYKFPPKADVCMEGTLKLLFGPFISLLPCLKFRSA